MRRLWLLLFLAGCGGSDSSTPSPAPTIALPPLTEVRSDLISADEGGLSHPLQVSGCHLPVTPGIVGQTTACNLPRTVYPVLNHVAGPAHNVWRVMVNFEDAWDGKYGPPNQSMALDGKPFSLTSSADSATLRLDGVGVDKIPYLSIAYLRGVQGDPVPLLSRWGSIPKLSFTASLAASGSPQWVMVWFHFKDSAGNRYMARHDLYSPETDRADGQVPWNWPAVNSAYYPGAKLSRVRANGGPYMTSILSTAYTFDIQAMSRKMFPEFDAIKPDFQGVEIAIEQAAGLGSMALTVSRVRLGQ